MHAAEALTLAGGGAEVRSLLEPKLKTEQDDQHRCGLARELMRAGDRSKSAIMLDILSGSNPYGHVHACESLYKLNEIGDGTLMRAAMKATENSKKMLMAAAALARWGNPQAYVLLRRSLGSDDDDTARIAAWVLARIGDERDIPPLRKRLQRADDRMLQVYLEHALATLGDAQGLAALARNLDDEDAAIRTYAATFAADARATSTAGRLTELLDDKTLDVRVRAAQSLVVLADPAPVDPREVVVHDVYPTTKENPRNSEGAVVVLRDGTLLYATTKFTGSASDFAKAGIVARASTDGGRTWGSQRVLQKNVGGMNVMSATLRRLASPVRENTPIGLFYLVKNSHSDLRVYLRISTDEAQTFGDPVLVTDAPGYHVLNNDRVTLLSTGRLLVPVASTSDVGRVNHFKCFCFYSDDQGKTWKQGTGKVDYAKRGAMEPEVLELTDGRVLMILRTQLGHIAFSHSQDKGETWSAPASWNVRAPEAPATLRRIPSTGDFLLIWNDTYSQGAGHGGKRTPLTTAVSTDEGRTWTFKRQLETNPDNTYAYTSLTFDRARALVTYYVRDEQTKRISSRFRSLPIGWFYEKQAIASK